MSGWLWIILLIAGYLFSKFLIERNKDNLDLQGGTAAEKFKFIVEELNKFAYDSKGEVTILDKRSFNLYTKGSNQIIQFQYSTGILVITWRYKYFQKEVVHEREFYNVRNISLLAQLKIAETIKEEIKPIILRHQFSVLSE